MTHISHDISTSFYLYSVEINEWLNDGCDVKAIFEQSLSGILPVVNQC